MNLLNLVGNTPLVEIKGFTEKDVKVYAKLEMYNLGGSIKTRIALSMINEAETSGELTKDKTIIEASSGNTGIGIAIIASIKGYKVKIILSRAVTEERKILIKKLGAELLIVDGDTTDDAIKKAHEIFNKNPDKYWMPNQFDNPNNTLAHYNNTAVEIIKQMPDITHFIAGIGTSGTLMGCAKKLKEHDKEIKIIGVHPSNNIPGLKNMKISIIPKIYNPELLDQKLDITIEEATNTLDKLHKKGFLVGYSSGAAMAGAIKIAKKLKKANIIVIFPDGFERYLSKSNINKI